MKRRKPDAPALWSRAEIALQAAQVPGQLTVWDVLGVTTEPCAACGAGFAEACDPFCLGKAAHDEAVSDV